MTTALFLPHENKVLLSQGTRKCIFSMHFFPFSSVAFETFPRLDHLSQGTRCLLRILKVCLFKRREIASLEPFLGIKVCEMNTVEGKRFGSSVSSQKNDHGGNKF